MALIARAEGGLCISSPGQAWKPLAHACYPGLWGAGSFTHSYSQISDVKENPPSPRKLEFPGPGVPLLHGVLRNQPPSPHAVSTRAGGYLLRSSVVFLLCSPVCPRPESTP